MILNQYIEKHWNPRNKKDFIEKGYSFTKMYDVVLINIKDLSDKDKVKVKCNCDSCGKEFQVAYHIALKDCRCQECKKKETYLKHYGATHNMKSKKGKEEYQKSVQEKYHVNNVFELESIKQKIKNACLEKYDVEHPLQNENILKKEQQTNLKKYHVLAPTQNKEILQKSINTLMKNYHVDSPLKNKEILKKQRQNMNNISKYQKRICTWLNGTLNYRISKYCLDIALIKEKIDVEYDGGGHDLEVIMKRISKENFVQKEQKRNKFLISRGWKIIRIISKKDKHINKNEFLTVFSHCLKKNFKLIKIFIDTKILDIDGNVADIKDFVYNND